MPSKKPLITLNVPQELKQAIADASKQAGKTQSEWLRDVIGKACESAGISAETNMDHGGKRMFYGLITTNRSGYGLNSCEVSQGKLENREDWAMLSYNGNYHITDYYETQTEAQVALDDMLDELYPE